MRLSSTGLPTVLLRVNNTEDDAALDGSAISEAMTGVWVQELYVDDSLKALINLDPWTVVASNPGVASLETTFRDQV